MVGACAGVYSYQSAGRRLRCRCLMCRLVMPFPTRWQIARPALLRDVPFSHFFFQAEDGIRDWSVTGVQTCALPISSSRNSFKMSRKSIFRVGVDTGGTFTDFVVIHDRKIEVFKELSTPQEPEEAIMKGLARAGNSAASEVIHGSTVATNALLERKGARTALLTTEGFEDILVIARQTRRELYNIFVTRPDPLVPAGLRMGVRERTLYDGSIATPLDQDHLHTLINRLRSETVESVAVSISSSFENC